MRPWDCLKLFPSNVFPSRNTISYHTTSCSDIIWNHWHTIIYNSKPCFICPISFIPCSWAHMFWLSYHSRTCLTHFFIIVSSILLFRQLSKMFIYIRDMELVFHVSNLYVFADCMHFHFYLLKGHLNCTLIFTFLCFLNTFYQTRSIQVLALTLRRELSVLMSFDLKCYF